MINKGPDGHELHFERNLIVIAAPFAGGKTHTIGLIHNFFFNHALWYGEPITDAVYIEDALEADHRYNDGMNHMHDNQTQPEIHEHYPGEPNLHFSVTGSFIPQHMHKRFFQALSGHTWNNRLFPVEWSGGVNTNPPDHPASHADYSFKAQIEGMRSGIYESAWVSKVLLVIHPFVPDGQIREEFNERRKDRRDPTTSEIAAGMRGWWIPESGMRITGQNDFLDVVPTLENMGLSGRIHVIANDGGAEYDQKLLRLLETAITPLLGTEGRGRETEGNSRASTRDRGRR